MNLFAVRTILSLSAGLAALSSARIGWSQNSFPPDPVPSAAAPAAGGEAIPGMSGAPGGAEPPTPTAQVGGAWVNIGPAPTVNAQVTIPPSNQVCGAIQAIAPHPANASILYIAAVNGGVWRTFNATATTPAWTPLLDAQPSLSMGAVEFDLADGTYQTLVAGSARISSFGAVGGARVGVYRTTDGGNSWSVLGSAMFANENLLSVAARGNVLMAGSDSQWGGGNGSGLFRSTDTGVSFTLVSGAGGTGLSAGPVSDLVADPGNVNRFYAAVRTVGIFRSDDAGATWSNVTANLTGISASTVKIEMAVHNSAGSNVVYVGVIGSANTLASVWRSPNQGASWTSMDVPVIHNGSQGQLHFSICADPANPAVVYLAGDRIAGSPFTGIIFRGDASLAPGSQFTSIVNANAGNTAPHADSRELVADANGNLLEGDDGGLYRRSSPLSNAGTWTSVIGNLATVEAHDVAYDSVAKVAMIGTQDNGTHLQSVNGSTLWQWISGGDGGDVAIDDKTTAGQSVRYGSSQNLGGFYRNTYNAANTLIGSASPALTVLGGGAAISFQFTTPVELNKVNPVRLIIGGGNSAYESLDQGNTVTALSAGFGVNGTFTAKPIAYGGWRAGVANPDVLYYGSGASVRVRTTAGGTVSATAAAFPGGTVLDLVLDTNDWQRVFAIDSASVFVSSNAGTNWVNITGDLTGVGTLRSLEFCGVQGTDCVVAGTDTGVYCSFVNNLGTWAKLGVGLPNVPAYDLTFSAVDNLLVAGTMGRGVYTFNVVSGLGGLSIADTNVIEGNSGFTNAVFTVTLAPAATNTVSVQFATANGTALAGSDFLATNGTLVFLPGESNKTLVVQVSGDTLPEADETFSVTLSAPTNAFLARASATGLIRNDDAPPALSIAAATVTEGNSGTTGAVFAVTLSGVSGATVTASYATRNVTALSGSDYLATNGIISFPPGVTSTSVVVRVNGDVLVEPDETFSVDLSAPANATLAISNAVGTILNDDGLPGQLDHFSWSAIASPQYVSQPFGVVVSALDSSNSPATNFTGAASLSAFASGGGTVFQANFESGLQGFTVDNTVGNGNGLWHLSTGRGADAGHSASQSLYYGMSEGLSGGGTYNTGGINEGAVISPSINLAGVAAPITLQFNYLLQTEGNASFDFALVEISTNNGASYATLANANLGGALTNNTSGLWLPATLSLSPYAGQQIRLRFHFNTVDNVANAFEGWYVDDLLITSAQSNPAMTPTVTGAFTNGVWAGAVTVLQTAANVFLRATDNNGHTGDSGTFNVLTADDLSITLNATPNPVLAGSTLTYTLAVSNSEPNSATGVLLTNVLPSSVTNPVVSSSQGTFSVSGNTVACDLGTLNAGSNAAVTITVTPLVAGSITNQATVYRTGPDGDPANNSATAITVVTVPSLTISNASLAEGNAGTNNLVFTVALSRPPALPVTVPYSTANLTATAGVDYLATNGVVTFLAGQTNATILVPVIGDTLFESDETFQVTLSSPTNATLATATATGTILNDDALPVVSIAGVSVVEGNAGTTNAVFVITLTPASGSAATVNFATAGNTATSGVDFAPASGVLTLPAGLISTSIVVQVFGDVLNEANETFFVNLSAPVNAALGTSQGTGTILDDDALPTIVAAGFTVVADYCNSNGLVDAGERVTLGFALRNTGATATASNLTATLLAAPDVFGPSGPQFYGPLAPGATKTNLFTFRANAICGATINPTLQLQDGANNLGPAAFAIALSGAGGSNIFTFTNSAAITIPDSGASTPYPSSISVSNLTGSLRKVTAKLKNMNHTWPDDLDILLVGPGGQKVMLMSDAGGSLDLINVTLTFDTAAASALPDSTQIVSGTYRPTDFEIGETLVSPAPAGPYITNLFAFTNSSPNGTWQLFVFDDAGGDQGNIAAGWELALTVVSVGSCCQSPLEFLAPVIYSNGTFQANAFVTPGQNYQIQASSNLFNWTPVTNVSSTSSPVLFVDPAASNFPARFYRGLSQ